MTEGNKWQTVEELLVEYEQTHFVSVSYMGRELKLAWKEISDIQGLDLLADKPWAEMTSKEQEDFNLKVMDLETLARIERAGENPECFNNNKITKEIWEKLPKRVRVMVMNGIFRLTDNLEKRF